MALGYSAWFSTTLEPTVFCGADYTGAAGPFRRLERRREAREALTPSLMLEMV
jgi:hypothetical protein